MQVLIELSLVLAMIKESASGRELHNGHSPLTLPNFMEISIGRKS